MPTTRKGWQEQIQEPVDKDLDVQATDPGKRQPGSPPRPSMSPEADDLQPDANPRSPKRRKSNDQTVDHPSPKMTKPNIVPLTNGPKPVHANPTDAAASASSTNSNSRPPAPTSMPPNPPFPPQAHLAQTHAPTQAPAMPPNSINTVTSAQTQLPRADPSPGPTSSTPTAQSSMNTPHSSHPNNATARPGAPIAPPPSAATPAMSTPASMSNGVPQQKSQLPPSHPAPQTQHVPQTQHQQSQGMPAPRQGPGINIHAAGQTPQPSSVNRQATPTQGPPTQQPRPPQQANVNARAPPVQPPSGPPVPAMPPAPPSPETKRANIPKLGDLSNQLLSLLSKLPVNDAMSLTQDINLLASGGQPLSPAPAEYQRLRGLFDPIRNMYVTNSAFLIAEHLQMSDPVHVETLRKANQAMYCSAIFTGGIGQLALDQSFLDVFVPQQGKMLKSQAAIWLELKTQAFMTAMRMKAAPPNQVMHDLFPAGIENRILARRPGSRTLAPSEQEFVNKFEERKRVLLNHVDRNALPELDPIHPYADLGKAVINYLIKAHARYLNTGVLSRSNGTTNPVASQGQMQNGSHVNGEPSNGALVHPDQNNQAPAPADDPTFNDAPSFTDIPIDELQRICKVAMKEAMKGTKFEEPESDEESADQPNQTAVQYPAQNTQPMADVQSTATVSASVTPSKQVIQQFPTHVLYQQARLVVPKSPTGTAAVAGQPGPWTDEEEKALMDAIDQVKGPHWSQILAMHGPSGSASQALKNRDQAQLKDKVNSLKSFFMKSNIGIPPYLSQVTEVAGPSIQGSSAKVEPDRPGAGEVDGQKDTPIPINQNAVNTSKGGHQEAVKVEEHGHNSLQSIPADAAESTAPSQDQTARGSSSGV